MSHVQLGRYQLTSELGRGGMGIVYKALDPLLERDLAIKLLPPKKLNQQMLERFLREARAVAKLDSSNIVKIYDIGRQPDGQYELNYIVMEFVAGCTLGEYFPPDPHLDTRGMVERLALFDQILDAMDYAHAQGVIHRDLKPDNVMVTEAGRAKIMDFGLAFFAGSHSLTRADQIMGTVAYFSPEQAKAAKDIDHRTDIYSLGVMLFELLCGELPFQAEHPLDMMQKLLTEMPRSLQRLNPRVPTALEEICERCLAKEPALRYPTVGALREDLRSVRGQLSAPTEAPTSVPEATRLPVVPTGVSDLSMDSLLPLAQPATSEVPAPVEVSEPAAVADPPPQPAASATAVDLGESRGVAQRPEGAPPMAAPPARIHSIHPSLASTDWHLEVYGQRQGEPPPEESTSKPVVARRPLSGPAVFCQCGGENPPESEICLECGEPIKPSIYIVRREAESHYTAGLAALRRGHLNEARAEFERAIEQNREFGEAYLEYGRVCLSLGDFETAHEALDQALELLPSKYDALMALADLYQQVEQPDDVVACLKEILVERPQEISIRCRLALIYTQQGRTSAALSAYRAALKYAPDDLSVNRQLGLLLAAENQVDEAIHYLEKVVRLDPRDASVKGLLGRLYAQAGQLRHAEEMFGQALEQRVEDPELRVELGDLYLRQGRADRALHEFQRTLTRQPGHLGANRQVAELYLQQGNFEGAKEALLRGIRFHPEDSDLRRQLGEVYLALGQLDGALDCFEKVVELRPDCHQMRNRLGRIYLKKEYDSQSIAEYSQAVKLNPLDPGYREDLGMAYYVSGELEKAASELHKAAKLDGRNGDYFRALGFIYLELGVADQAVAHFRWALHVEPGHAQTHGALGQALSQQGLANLAIDEYRRALALDSSLGLLHLSLARALSSAGRHQEAVESFQSFADGLGQGAHSQMLSRAFLEMGESLLQAGDLGQAAEVFQAALGQPDEEANARLGLARISMARSDLAAAGTHLARALELEPLNSGVWEVWSRLAAEKGEWSDAVGRMERAVDLDPERVELWEQLGRACRKSGRPERADQVFAQAAERFPSYRSHFNWLRGRLAIRRKDWSLAYELLERSLREAPGSWRLHEDMAHACLGLANWALAREHVERAAELAPESGKASVLALLERIES